MNKNTDTPPQGASWEAMLSRAWRLASRQPSSLTEAERIELLGIMELVRARVDAAEAARC